MSDFQLEAAVQFYSALKAIVTVAMLVSAPLLVWALYKMYVLRDK